MQTLQGKVAVVAGATRGAGRGIAAELGAAGAVVYCTGRSVRGKPATDNRPETIEETAEIVSARGGVGISVQTDHTAPEQVQALMERVRAEQSGRLDILVNIGPLSSEFRGGAEMRARRQPDFEQFLKVLTRRGRPDHLPCYEHLASPGFIARWTGQPFDRMGMQDPAYWRVYVDFWLDMGFDCIPMEIPLNCPLPARETHAGAVSHESEATVCIRTLEDFESYPWPPESNPIEFRHFETVAALLPEGVKIVGGVCAGPYEWATYMMGVVGLSLSLFDNPELVTLVFEKLDSLHASAHRQLATMEAIGALRQGDDLGFKTSTFLKPRDLRRHVFPIYRRLAEAAHAQNKPFILHSCGNLKEVYEDIIACGVDAKHSFEETILPVEQFKARYGDRCTPLGGLDVDIICRGTEEEIRRYTRQKIEQCFGDGWWALGTGNSLTDYMPTENYRIVLEEGQHVGG